VGDRPHARAAGRVAVPRDEVTEHSGTEIGWTLAWTESYAFAQVLLGQALLGRLPAVWAACWRPHRRG
jgi:hypothetical protein